MQPDDLRAFMAEHPLGVVSTHNAERGPEAALVSFALADDGAILFDTFADSRKMANLQAAYDLKSAEQAIGARLDAVPELV